MAKSFAPRVSKRKRKTIDMTDRLERDLFKISDEKLLRDAKLEDMELRNITVKEQVRTKFNDSSLKELAENIRVNGLIQPLVIHEESENKFVLICGERRFRAMTLIEQATAPCFILANKTPDELMAIQFSENSAREELHYVDKADGIYNYQKATKASERQIVKALGISKSEVHRSLMIAKLPTKLKEAAKKFNTEKYVLIEFDSLELGEGKKGLEKKVLNGEITKRAQLKRSILKLGLVIPAKKKTAKRVSTVTESSDVISQALSKKKKSKKLDRKTKDLIKKLLEEQPELLE